MKKIEKVLSDKKDIIYIGNHKQPKIIYKYRNWLDCYNQNVIKNNELYLSSPKDFNDPFDCKITPNYYQLDSKEKIMKYALIVIERNKQYLNSIGLNLNDEALKIYNRFVADPAKEQIILNKISIEIQDKFYGVLSMSCIWNSILMWSHYSDKHKGYCIGFHEEKLRESGSFGKGGKVKYDKYPEIDLLEKDLMKISFINTPVTFPGQINNRL